MIDRAESLRNKALQYVRAAKMAAEPDVCRTYLELALQLRATAELAEALKQAANLRRGIWWQAPGIGQ
jgi:hypothetical protein